MIKTVNFIKTTKIKQKTSYCYGSQNNNLRFVNDSESSYVYIIDDVWVPLSMDLIHPLCQLQQRLFGGVTFSDGGGQMDNPVA